MMGARIAALRRDAGWSQAELGRRLRVSASAVGMYEQGRREPSLQSAVELSRAFGVSVDYLLTGVPLTESDSAAMTKVLEKEVQSFPRGRPGGFSREELAVLFAAMLTEA